MAQNTENSQVNSRIEVIQGDITKLDVVAIVNAANRTLLGGSGVDGAIHSAAGPGLLDECRSLGGCDTGDAKITNGYDLPAKYVIHTVGPVYADGTKGEEELLASCYRKSLEIAAKNHISSIAFPCISTGVYGYPFEEASAIAIDEIRQFLRTQELSDNVNVEEVFLVCFSSSDYERLRDANALAQGTI